MRHTPFDGIEVFLAIIEHGSLRAAARELGIGAPAVSYQLKTLEQNLGVNLLVRTTRSTELTDAGRALLEGATPAMFQLKETLEKAREIGRSRQGVLRITLPWSAYKIAIAPILDEFRSQYPDVRLEMSFDESLVDIIKNGYHAGIRLGDRLAPEMIAVRLTEPLLAAYSASPAYLRKHGRPSHPRDLLDHNCIRYRYISANRLAEWRFLEDGQIITLDPPASLVFDGFQSVIEAAKQGHGIGWSLRAVIEEELQSGTLESLVEPYVTEHPPFFLYFPEQYRKLELLRLLIDFLMARRTRSHR